MAKKIDMTGWVMKEHGVPDSKWTVIKEVQNYAKNNGLKDTSAYWLCKCECGTEKVINGCSLRAGKTKTCGCSLKTNAPWAKASLNLVGLKFGNLLAIEKTEKRNKRGDVLYKCQCDCGKITYVTATNLKSGNTKSCGCMIAKNASLYNRKEITGQSFGKLTAIKYLRTNKRGNRIYLCQCECGQTCEVTASHLIAGHTASCGCINSQGELKIQQILKDNNIFFIKQKTFKDCLSNKKGYLKFDFYINNSFLLEFDGEQHNRPVSFFGGTTSYETLQENDLIKNKYCLINNIPLKRIPYKILNTLTIEDIMGDKYLVHSPNN